MRGSIRVASVAAALALVTWLMWERPAVESHTVIRIVNHDTVRHHLGIFDADPGETRDFSVAYAGTFGGYCSAHAASRQLVYVIE